VGLADACLPRLLRALWQARAMGYDRAQFVVQGSVPAVDGYECAICHDVVRDATSCLQGHRRAARCAPVHAQHTSVPAVFGWFRRR
jgi:hypothetical protein